MTIDWWTLALQTVNFLDPGLDSRAVLLPADGGYRGEAAGAANKLLADAAAARQEADGVNAEADKACAAIAAVRDRLMAEARRRAGQEKANGWPSSQAIASGLARRNAAIARDRQAAEQAVLAHPRAFPGHRQPPARTAAAGGGPERVPG